VSADLSTSRTDAAPPKTRGRAGRRIIRLSWMAAIAVVALAVPAGAYGVAHGFITHGNRPVNSPPSAIKYQVGRHSVVSHAGSSVRAATSGTGYDAYVALAGGYSIAEVDVSTDTIISDSISADTPEGVAVTPDGSQIFVAETGQYQVIAVNPTTLAETPIFVGAYPQDVAVSPDGSVVYATVTGGDTGAGGSDVVAVISTSTDTVVGDITVGTAPRQVVFSPGGATAYVSTEDGVDVIDTASQSMVARIPDPSGPQGLALSPDGSTLYVTNPALDSVWVIDTATDHLTGTISTGAEPYGVAITPDGTQGYVTDMNADTVSVFDTATDAVTATIPVGHLPSAVAIVPDGSQVWVGNILDGDITVIDPATNTVSGTITGGTGTATLDAQPLSIAFTAAP